MKIEWKDNGFSFKKIRLKCRLQNIDHFDLNTIFLKSCWYLLLNKMKVFPFEYIWVSIRMVGLWYVYVDVACTHPHHPNTISTHNPGPTTHPICQRVQFSFGAGHWHRIVYFRLFHSPLHSPTGRLGCARELSVAYENRLKGPPVPNVSP